MSESFSYIDNSEKIARAIFSPAMIDDEGRISKAAFSLRHNESYISVARMSIEGWLNDIKSIPVNSSRQLEGYGILIVGDVRTLEINFFDKKVSFLVDDKSSSSNKSHAGIIIVYNEMLLKGDKNNGLKPLEKHIPASMLLLKIQTKLANIANKAFVRI